MPKYKEVNYPYRSTYGMNDEDIIMLEDRVSWLDKPVKTGPFGGKYEWLVTIFSKEPPPPPAPADKSAEPLGASTQVPSSDTSGPTSSKVAGTGDVADPKGEADTTLVSTDVPQPPYSSEEVVVGVPPPPVPPAEADDVLAERVAKKRDLKAEALAPEHLMTHFPKNPYCEVCSGTKVRRIGHYHGALAQSPDQP